MTCYQTAVNVEVFVKEKKLEVVMRPAVCD